MFCLFTELSRDIGCACRSQLKWAALGPVLRRCIQPHQMQTRPLDYRRKFKPVLVLFE
jgi:hypothetical protein